MPTPRRFRPGRFLTQRGWWVLPLVLAIALATPWTFGARWYTDAPYYQAIATQMAREGGSTWLSPMQGDLPYFNKPPLAFWIHAVLVKAFGDADWAAHLPEAVCYALVCLQVGWLARRMHGSLTGFFAACAMALTSEWVVRVSNFKLDSLHTVLLLGAMMCWARAFVPHRGDADRTTATPVRWCVLAGVCLGAALMTKPLYALALVPFALAWLWGSGLLTSRRAALVLLSGAIGAALAAPWHVWMVAHHGQAFVKAYIHEQTVQRALGEFHDHQSWDWYLRLIAGTIAEAERPERMWPIYALALAGLGVVAWGWARGALVSRAARAGSILAAMWTVGWFVGLSLFGGKRNYYLMVVHPGTAWLAGLAIAEGVRVLGRVSVERNGRWSIAVRCVRGAAVAGLVASVILIVRLPWAVAEARRSQEAPERDEFMRYVREQHGHGEAIYDCGLSYRTASLTYIEAGVWPRALTERVGRTPHDVPVGGLMCYRADKLAEGSFGTYVDPADELLFRSSPTGRFIVYRRRGTK